MWDVELGYWRWIHGTMQFEISPVSAPYSPQMVKSGITRPETMANLWISDPGESLPQSLSVEWSEPVEIGSVQLTFDSQLSGWIWEGAFPMIPRQYQVEGRLGDGSWKVLVDQTGNYLRRREHRFESQTVSALRISILETHGGHTARIVEVRAYPTGAGKEVLP